MTTKRVTPKYNNKKNQAFICCTSCQVTFLSRDLGFHSIELCRTLEKLFMKNDLTELERKEKLPHGFIRDRLIFGPVIHKKIEAEMIKALPGSGQNNIALLHPTAMQLSNIRVGDKVLIELPQQRQKILTAWPSSSIPSVSSGMHPMNVILTSPDSKKYSNSHCFISMYKLSHIAASRVILNPNCKHNYHNSESFKSYFLQDNDEVYLSHKSKVKFKYFGKICKFHIEEIIGENGTMSDPKESKQISAPDRVNETIESRHDLSESMSSIDLSSLSLSEADVSSSTPKSSARSASLNEADLRNFSLDFEGSQYFYLTADTAVSFVGDSSPSNVPRKAGGIRFSDIGGLKTQVDEILGVFQQVSLQNNLIQVAGCCLMKNILLYGPPGTGKTMIGQAIANEMNRHFVAINGPEVFRKNFGETEENLRSIFKEAASQFPSIIFLDEIDALCPNRESVQTDLEKRVISTLLTEIDELGNSQTDVIIIAATNKPDSLDPALRRSGRLDKEVEIGIPDAEGRYEILVKILGNIQHNLNEEKIKVIADNCHGYTGADLKAVVAEAGAHIVNLAIKRLNNDVSDEELALHLKITARDIKHGLRIVKPSVMREIRLEIPKVFWNDIGGLDDLKLKLKQAVEWPLKHPEAFRKMGIKPPNGVLMYGPPGCSKTMIAKALATESGLNFLSIKGPELFSKWVGESERAVREVFQKARSASPSIIFFDEIDALASERGSSSGSSGVGDRVLTQLLTEMDGIEYLENVVIVAATNRPDMIDKALMRPGRFDRIIHVPLPDLKAREKIFEVQFMKTPVEPDVSASALAQKTESYSGAEIVAVCQEACLLALEEDINTQRVQLQYFERTLKTVKPRINPELVKFYEDFQNSKYNI